ncbi:hypothetical protein LTR86_011193 [Recurvomyces mirabilis]|nr:hypothetical protein LTR86_011193 [Recurvomyces mirabilis]
MAQAQLSVTTRIRYLIGRGVKEELVAEAREKLAGTRTHEHYRISPGTRFIFEALDDKENSAKTVVDSWLSNRDNLDTIAPGHEVELKAYAAIRISKLPYSVHLNKGIREEEGFVILIPLERWSEENGCFFGDTVIQPGQYLCLGGLEPITVPASKACGLLIWFFIQIRDQATR